jgi:KDO2-lipid IV(A) lauroyltransferase
MRLREHLEYAATAALLKICRRLPEEAVYSLFKSFGLLIYRASARRRSLSLRNMEIAFPEKTPGERTRLVKQAYLNLAESMAVNTLITTGKISDTRLLDMIDVENWDQLRKLIETSEKGLLFFTGHIGNWELMSQYLGMRIKQDHGKLLNVIARKTNNQLLEDRVVRPLRERFGVNVLYKKNAFMRSVKALNRGEPVGTLIDQRLNLQEGIAVDFFGKEAGTSGMPALLQIRFGITALPIFMIKHAPRKYRFFIGDPVLWNDNGMSMEEQVLELTRVHQKILEDKIRQYPDQWFWMHNRWGLPKAER